MNPHYKKVLYLNLEEKKYEFKIQEDLNEYVGGIGIATKLLIDNLDLNPVVIASGPLGGYFPYVSKTCVVYLEGEKLKEKYGGGWLGAILNNASIDALLISGFTSEPTVVEVFQDEVSMVAGEMKDESYVNKAFDLEINNDGIFSKDYFGFGNTSDLFLKTLSDIRININITEAFEFKDYYEYEKLYKKILDDYTKLTVEPANNPSCYGCPIGCEKSYLGEDDLNIAVLPRTLVACGYAEQIYKNIPFVYACLSSVGYLYQHEDLEDLPNLLGVIRKKINEIFDS